MKILTFTFDLNENIYEKKKKLSFDNDTDISNQLITSS